VCANEGKCYERTDKENEEKRKLGIITRSN
jgi:hypothetical protein